MVQQHSERGDAYPSSLFQWPSAGTVGAFFSDGITKDHVKHRSQNPLSANITLQRNDLQNQEQFVLSGMLTVFWTLSLRRPQNRLSFFPERLNQIAPSDWSPVRMLRMVHFEVGGL